jgi:transposase
MRTPSPQPTIIFRCFNGHAEQGAMRMITIEFTDEDKQALHYERFHHPHPRVQQKMEALWFKSQGLAHHTICQLTCISKPTLCQYLKDYQRGGIDQLKTINFYQPTSALGTHHDTREAYFRDHPMTGVKEAMAKIEELTGIKRSEPQIRHFMTSLGMKPRKVGMIPAKADPEKQEQFKHDELEPVLDEARAKTRKVFSVDAAHFVLAPFLGILWSFTRLFIKAPAGRKRFNVLGALDVLTHELITVTNDTYINALSVCELLRKLRAHFPAIPITLLVDNARYQKCRLVWELAAELNIDLLYLPAYSPNLQLIERLWKFVKKTCLYSHYYADFASFKSAITDCLEHTHDQYKEDLDSLLTLNFQTFKDVEKVNIMTL